MRRPLVAAALGVLAAAAVLAGVLVLTSGAGTPPDAAPTRPPATTGPALAATGSSPAATGPATPTVAARQAGQPPGTVRLPEGGTATLVRRELTPDGTLPIPDGLDEATWWGARLGAPRGAALLSGHVNWAGRSGPFAELWRSRPGQRVRVVDTAGGEWVYRVTEVVTLHKTELPRHAQRLFSPTGPHRLVLVTCGGDYVGGTDGYEDNRIVTAELVTRP
ncbi:sortase family protein [Prauserella shujinwangii]|uniref:Sortase family protein n=1 Tax=Prauserella shujinwangii TaxID=1453103 RepID=A0A2T0LTM3_9PSEU|nr:class F sortase [Prauserella shujinwangii]PRX47089.1 sortase family protein [Prauserella shujinwangii]